MAEKSIREPIVPYLIKIFGRIGDIILDRIGI